MAMMVSVIVPMYNVGRYVEQCAVSLFEQDYHDIEYIFVDDCSTDDSVDVLNSVVGRYADVVTRVKIIRHDGNKGVAATRNTALDAASGDYICYVDGDDWIEKDTISALCRAAEGGRYDLVSCDWFLSYEKGERAMAEPVADDVEANLRTLFSGKKHWYLWMYMAKRSLYADNSFRFIEGADSGEDMMMVLKLFSVASTYMHVNRHLYHYRKTNSGSLTFNDPSRQLEKISRNVEEIFFYFHNRYKGGYDNELRYMQLSIKFPLLISANKNRYQLWNKTYPEANAYIWQNREMAFRNKFIQWAAVHRFYFIPWLYYTIAFRIIYRTLYK